MDHERHLFMSLVAVLLGFGALMVHSASITSRPGETEQVFLSRHLVYVTVGVLAATAAGLMPGAWWRRLAPWLFVTTLGLLILVLVPGVGAKINGARRWFRFGGLSFQPSELAKITLPLYVCLVIDRRRGQLNSWVRGLVPPAIPAACLVPLVMLQPDLGTSLFLACAAGVALFSGGWPVRNFVLGAALALPAVGYVVLHRSYQMERIYGFIKTWSDWNAAPYHLKQSLLTLGGGGLWGVGLGKGSQKLSFLPEANTDFVFAVIGEELGLMGTLTVIGLWVGLYVLGLRMLGRIPRDSFAYNASFTLLTQLVFQVLLNVAVVTAMVPPKGIPHPLISYGGSNLVVSLVAIGVVLSLTRVDEVARPGEPAS